MKHFTFPQGLLTLHQLQLARAWREQHAEGAQRRLRQEVARRLAKAEKPLEVVPLMKVGIMQGLEDGFFNIAPFYIGDCTLLLDVFQLRCWDLDYIPRAKRTMRLRLGQSLPFSKGKRSRNSSPPLHDMITPALREQNYVKGSATWIFKKNQNI